VKNCQVLDFESGSGVAKYLILPEIAVLEGDSLQIEIVILFA
jgi:hypothetical protein